MNEGAKILVHKLAVNLLYACPNFHMGRYHFHMAQLLHGLLHQTQVEPDILSGSKCRGRHHVMLKRQTRFHDLMCLNAVPKCRAHLDI